MESTELDKLAHTLFINHMIKFDPMNKFLSPPIHVFIYYKEKELFSEFYDKARLELRKNKINKIKKCI